MPTRELVMTARTASPPSAFMRADAAGHFAAAAAPIFEMRRRDAAASDAPLPMRTMRVQPQ